jgi:hypothetical protein
MDHVFFERMIPLMSAPCMTLHENALQFTAVPGDYVVVLATSEPRTEGKFFARMVVERSVPRMRYFSYQSKFLFVC